MFNKFWHDNEVYLYTIILMFTTTHVQRTYDTEIARHWNYISMAQQRIEVEFDY